jgi:hypothetical protein
MTLVALPAMGRFEGSGLVRVRGARLYCRSLMGLFEDPLQIH